MVIYQSINDMQRYRSGHNEAVLKTVWVHAHVGSNPTLCAKNSHTTFVVWLFLCCGIRNELQEARKVRRLGEQSGGLFDS